MLRSITGNEANVKRAPRPTRELDDLTAIRRTAKVVRLFMLGEALTIRQVSELTGTTERNARYMLEAISSVIEIYDEHGTWQLCVFREAIE